HPHVAFRPIRRETLGAAAQPSEFVRSFRGARLEASLSQEDARERARCDTERLVAVGRARRRCSLGEANCTLGLSRALSGSGQEQMNARVVGGQPLQSLVLAQSFFVPAVGRQEIAEVAPSEWVFRRELDDLTKGTSGLGLVVLRGGCLLVAGSCQAQVVLTHA